MVFDKTGEVIKELSESLLKRSQIEWETLVKASDFIMDYIHKINVNQGGWYIDLPDWIKNKKSNNKSCH